jgi:hypothetical protein
MVTEYFQFPNIFPVSGIVIGILFTNAVKVSTRAPVSLSVKFFSRRVARSEFTLRISSIFLQNNKHHEISRRQEYRFLNQIMEGSEKWKYILGIETISDNILTQIFEESPHVVEFLGQFSHRRFSLLGEE